MNPEYVEPFNSRNQEIGGANTTNRRGAARQALAFRPVSRHRQALAVCPVSRRAAPRRFFSHCHGWPPLQSGAQKEHQQQSPGAASFARHRKRWHTK